MFFIYIYIKCTSIIVYRKMHNMSFTMYIDRLDRHWVRHQTIKKLFRHIFQSFRTTLCKKMNFEMTDFM